MFVRFMNNSDCSPDSKLENSRESSITVAVRVRPFTTQEQNCLIEKENDLFFLGKASFSSSEKQSIRKNPKGIRKIIDVVDEKMLIFDPPETNPLTQMQRQAFPKTTNRIREHRFVFDRLFDEDSRQDDVFCDTTKPLLDSFLDGYNATVFAYGATGCGKTYTILGTPEDPGIIFLTMQELYKRIDNLSETKIFDVSLSFLEIYNETIRDLLNPTADHKKLILREDVNQKISVSNLSSHKPNSVEDVMQLLIIGNSNRTTSPTDANATSSRSHAVLQINVSQRDKISDVSQQHTFATLSIIDLAGSERAAATKNRGARLNEGANINKSLLALGNCINALCDPRRRNHIPYRDSKLTRLLKFSLGGNCKTVMIVCVSPSSQHYDETLNTLKYADRAKEIKTKVIRNKHNLDRHVGSYLKMITEQKQEIELLRSREAEIIDRNLHKQKENIINCLNSMQDSIAQVRISLEKQFNERWRKYFILAKRKLLLIQRIDIDTLLYEILQTEHKPQSSSIIIELGEQLISKIDSQITELESQYNSRNELDYLFNEKSEHVLRRLNELEGWTDEMSNLYILLMEKEHESLEREILFHSSILFDYLVHQLHDFRFLPRHLAHSLVDNISNKLISILEQLNGGDYDVAIEQYAFEFMQAKQQENELSNGLKRPGSPVTLSPPRNSKRVSSSSTVTPKQSPVLKKSPILTIKKVRWDVPKNTDISMIDSDASFDDSVLHMPRKVSSQSADQSTSPIGSDFILDGDIDFDTSIRSSSPILNPPVSISKNITNTNGKFNNRRLSMTLTSSDEDIALKIPLLNKQASKKVLSSTSDTSDTCRLPVPIPGVASMPSPTLNTTPQIGNPITSPKSTPTFLSGSPPKFPKMDSPSKIINQFSSVNSNNRNIESVGSEKVE